MHYSRGSHSRSLIPSTGAFNSSLVSASWMFSLLHSSTFFLIFPPRAIFLPLAHNEADVKLKETAHLDNKDDLLGEKVTGPYFLLPRYQVTKTQERKKRITQEDQLRDKKYST